MDPIIGLYFNEESKGELGVEVIPIAIIELKVAFGAELEIASLLEFDAT